MAEFLGIDRNYLSEIETGNKDPSLRVLRALADGCGLTLSQFLRRIRRLWVFVQLGNFPGFCFRRCKRFVLNGEMTKQIQESVTGVFKLLFG
jgi:transcriptional regulator with XRE-family HTH domain